MDKKGLYMIIYMRHSVKKKHFKVKISFTDQKARLKNFSRIETIFPHGKSALTLLGQNAIWTNSTSGKKKKQSRNISRKDSESYRPKELAFKVANISQQRTSLPTKNSLIHRAWWSHRHLFLKRNEKFK